MALAACAAEDGRTSLETTVQSTAAAKNAHDTPTTFAPRKAAG